VNPESARAFVSFLLRWQGLWRLRRGRDGLRRSLRQLQDLSLPFSELESRILPARLRDYSPMQLDELIRSGEFVWQGDRYLARHDGHIRLFAASDFPRLGRMSAFVAGPREQQIRDLLLHADGIDFAAMLERLGGFPNDLANALWKLAGNGEISSDSLAALRARSSSRGVRHHLRRRPRYATRGRLPAGVAGRWRLLTNPDRGFAGHEDREMARAAQLLDRYGVLCRSVIAGFDELHPRLVRLEAQGGALRTRLLETDGDEFAVPGAEQVWREAQGQQSGAALSACDPANPFGSLLPWPSMNGEYQPGRVPGARVLIHGGLLVGYLSRSGRELHIPEALAGPGRVVKLLQALAASGPVFLESVDGAPPREAGWHDVLVNSGFSPSPRGYLLRVRA